jgi:hypothetical protein
MESIKHRRRGSVNPSLIHIHGHKLVQKWAVFASASPGVLWHYVIRRVDMEPVLICYSANNGRFSSAASAANPVHTAQPFA